MKLGSDYRTRRLLSKGFPENIPEEEKKTLQKQALFKELFRHRTEPSPVAQALYDTFLKAYNPEKNRFKDQGWQEAFKKQVSQDAENLQKELDQHLGERTGMLGQFWKAVKKALPLEVVYKPQIACISTLLRKTAQELTASGGYTRAPRDIEFEHHLVRKDDQVRWEGRDFGGQYRVEFKTDRGQTMGYLVYDSRNEFEDEWEVRTADYHLNSLRDGMRWGEFLSALDEQHQNAIPLRNIERTEKYLGRKIAAGTEDGECGFEYVEETRRIGLLNDEDMSPGQQINAYLGSSSVHRVIEAFNLESEAHGIYMSYALSPNGKASYRRALKKFPGYNTDRREAEKAADMIMKNLKFRVRGPQENLGQVLNRVRQKVLEGIL